MISRRIQTRQHPKKRGVSWGYPKWIVYTGQLWKILIKRWMMWGTTMTQDTSIYIYIFFKIFGLKVRKAHSIPLKTQGPLAGSGAACRKGHLRIACQLWVKLWLRHSIPWFIQILPVIPMISPQISKFYTCTNHFLYTPIYQTTIQIPWTPYYIKPPSTTCNPESLGVYSH